MSAAPLPRPGRAPRPDRASLPDPRPRTERPLRVLMTADAVGGVWTYAIELIGALHPHGVDVTLATMGPAPDEVRERELREAAPDAHLAVSRFRLEWMDDPWDDVDAAGEWLLDLAGRVRPDLVHLNGYSHAVLPWGVPVVVVGHSCVLSWWESVLGEPAPPRWQRYREAVHAGLHAADLVVAPTRAMLAALHRIYGPLPTGRVIHNGCSPDASHTWEKQPVVLSVGRLWDEAKNFEALDEAAAAVRWPVRVAGEDRHPQGGRRPMRWVHTLGVLPRGELERELASASIYVLPVRYEPFGLSILEAASHGCALVLGDIPSLRELWNGCALWVSPDDPRALARAMSALIDHREERERLALAARRRSMRFNVRRMALRYASVYRDLVGLSAPAARRA